MVCWVEHEPECFIDQGRLQALNNSRSRFVVDNKNIEPTGGSLQRDDGSGSLGHKTLRVLIVKDLLLLY